MLDELTAVAVGAGLDGVVYDMVRQGKNETSYDYREPVGRRRVHGGASARALPRQIGQRAAVWSDTSMWNALE